MKAEGTASESDRGLARALARLGGWTCAHPWRAIAAAALPCLALGAVAARAPVDLSFGGFVDFDQPVLAHYRDVGQALGLTARLPLLLEGPEDQLDRAAAELTRALGALPGVERVIPQVPAGWLRDQLPWLVDRAGFDAWLRLATHPEDASAAPRLEASLRALEREHRARYPEGARLLQVQLARDVVDQPLGETAFREIRDRTRDELAGSAVRAAYAGIPAMAQQDQERVLRQVKLLTPLSLIAVLLLLLGVERRPLYLAAVAVPLLLSVAATLGVVALVLGTITATESFFGIMVFGLGVDFALHLMVRLREERAAGHAFEEALRRSMLGCGPGIAAGAATTAGAFLIVALAPDPVAQHLGLSGAAGLTLCLGLMLVLLPALWALLERWSPGAAPSDMSLPWLGAVAGRAARHPWTTLALAAALALLALAGAPRYRFETDLEKVFSRDVPALAAIDRIQQLFGVNAGPWVALVQDLPQARQVEAGWRGEPLVAKVDSLAQLIPVDAPERHAAIRSAAPDIEDQRLAYQTLRKLAGDDEATRLAQAVELLQTLEQAARSGPPTPDRLPEALRSLFVARDGRLAVYAYTDRPNLDGLRARQERLAVQAHAPGATGFPVLLEALLLADRAWFKLVFAAIVAFVAALLWLDLRRWRDVLVAMSPVLFGTTLAFGAMCWLDLGFNLMTLCVVPLVIGLGVDDGIHVVHRLREQPEARPDQAAVAVGRAIVMTTLTTCAGFAVLLLTDHAGLQSMAQVMLIGMPACLLASVTLGPALATLLRRPGEVQVR